MSFTYGPIGHPPAPEHAEPHARPPHVHAPLQVPAVPEGAQQQELRQPRPQGPPPVAGDGPGALSHTRLLG